MRKLRRGAAVVLIAALAISGLACASAQRNAYRTIGSLSIGVDFAMNAWGEWVRAHAGQLAAEDEDKVKAGYVKYQESMATLKVAVLTYKAAKESGGPAEAGMLEAAIAGATDFAYKLVNLINSFRTGERPLTLGDFGPEIREAESLLYGGE